MKGLLSASLIAMFLALPSAWAQGKCLPHDQAKTNLKRHYGEEAVGVGLGTEGQTVFELFVADTGTWTILVTRTNGLSCVAASGNDWSKLAPVDVAEEGT
jgi:hypothetical protein